MSRFASLLQSIAATHRGHFGSAVTYRLPGSTTPTPATAVVHPSRTEQRMVGGDTVMVTVRTVRFPDLAALRHDAIITIDGDDYSIDAYAHPTLPGVTVDLVQSRLREAARPGYRR